MIGKSVNRELLRGSLVLVVAFGIFNAFNFLFQAGMANFLSLAEFGVLSVLYNILYVMSGASESLQFMMAKYASNENENGKVKNVLKRALRKSWIISLMVFAGFLVVGLLISYLTDVEYYLVSFTGLLIFAVFLLPLNRGILQGRKKFFSLGSNMVFESLTKLLLSILFVFLGWSVFGAMLGTLLGALFAFLISFVNLKFIFKSKEIVSDTKDIYDISVPTFLVVLSVLVLYSFDVVIAKIIFDSEIAGAYAVVSLLAKSIFFGTQPITKAMFPLSSEKNILRSKSRNIFFNTATMLFIASIVALLLFYYFPSLIIGVFSGKDLSEFAGLLFYLGIGTTFLSFSNLVLLYKLSLGKTRGVGMLSFFVILEILAVSLVTYFNRSNIWFFSVLIILSSILLFLASLFVGRGQSQSASNLSSSKVFIP